MRGLRHTGSFISDCSVYHLQLLGLGILVAVEEDQSMLELTDTDLASQHASWMLEYYVKVMTLEIVVLGAADLFAQVVAAVPVVALVVGFFVGFPVAAYEEFVQLDVGVLVAIAFVPFLQGKLGEEAS